METRLLGSGPDAGRLAQELPARHCADLQVRGRRCALYSMRSYAPSALGRLNYSLHGLQSWGYHFGNLLVYAGVVLAVFALALLLFDRWGGACST